MSEKLEDTLTWKFYSGVCALGNFTTRASDKTSYSAKLATITNPGITGNIWFGFVMFFFNVLFVGLYPSYQMMKTFIKFKRFGLAVLVGWSFVFSVSIYPATFIGEYSSSLGYITFILIMGFSIFLLKKKLK